MPRTVVEGSARSPAHASERQGPLWDPGGLKKVQVAKAGLDLLLEGLLKDERLALW